MSSAAPNWARICSANFKSGIRNPESAILVRGLGLMVGLELRNRDGSPATTEALRIIKEMLRRGFILLPEGEHGNVISLTPPLTITEKQLEATVKTLQELLGHR